MLIAEPMPLFPWLCQGSVPKERARAKIQLATLVDRSEDSLRLPAFADHQFDCIILSQTLQTVTNVEHVLLDMLRVGRRAIVSFPNVGYWEFRVQLSTAGRSPRLYGMDGLSWHNTPNVRFLSIADFEEFCRERGILIHERIALDTESGERITDDPNFNADLGIFVLGR